MNLCFIFGVYSSVGISMTSLTILQCYMLYAGSILKNNFLKLMFCLTKVCLYRNWNFYDFKNVLKNTFTYSV